MSLEDMLDDMSLSDDELLDSLADDLLLEMEEEEQNDEEIQTIEPVRAAPRAAPSMPLGFPFGGGNPTNARAGAAGGMPDLSQMMQQMMPMMSQMFGGAGGAPGMMRGGNASLQQATRSWDEIVRQYVPASEQDEWLATIRTDEHKQRDDMATKRYNKPPSRSYHGDAKPLPNVYLAAETLLTSLLHESVRAKKAEHNATWKQYHDNLVSHVTQSGLARVFARELQEQLRRRVASDPDYAAARKDDPSRFSNIAKALAV